MCPNEAICVDGACSGNPGPMEYRGVHVPSGKEVFRFGPIMGTNNIGEFLAIVHALALMEQRGISMPIYSDSVSGQAWVRNKKGIDPERVDPLEGTVSPKIPKSYTFSLNVNF